MIAEAVSRLGDGPLTEDGVREHLYPLFRRVLARPEIYLANHTLGRPLDCAMDDIAEGAMLWPNAMRGAWDPWLAEERAHRDALAKLLGVERWESVVPKASAGAALRAVLNTLPEGATVVTTEGEFASVSAVLAQYSAVGRLRVVKVGADADGRWTAACVRDGMRGLNDVQLVVVSHVFYRDAQLFGGLPELARECHGRGAALLVDSYHAMGVLPFSFAEIGCDYCIGGCYKYLRGGPGAAFLAIAPEILDRNTVKPLDTGWFASSAGGDAWLEGTPAVLPYYQARSGLAFTHAVGIARLRAYGLQQLQFLREQLNARGIEAQGGDAGHGAFLTVATERATDIARAMSERGVLVDARDGSVRICPDVLTTRDELEHAAASLQSS